MKTYNLIDLGQPGRKMTIAIRKDGTVKSIKDAPKTPARTYGNYTGDNTTNRAIAHGLGRVPN